MSANRRPPITGGGMQKRSRKLIFLRRKYPIRSATTANASVWYMSIVHTGMGFSSVEPNRDQRSAPPDVAAPPRPAKRHAQRPLTTMHTASVQVKAVPLAALPVWNA